MRLTKKFLAASISAAMLIGAPAASAVSSAQQGYSKPGGIVQTQLENSGGSGNNPGAVVSNTPQQTTTAKSSGTLPFTGLDLVLVVGAGGLLLGLGLAMRRLTRSATVA